MEEKRESVVLKRKLNPTVKGLIRLAIFLLLFVLSLPLLIHIGPLQKLILNQFSKSLSSKTESKIKIGKIDFSIFKGLILKELYVSNANSPLDTLVYIGEFSTSLEENILSLWNNKVYINDLNLFEAKVNIVKNKGDEESNLEYFISQLSNKKESPNQKPTVPIELNLKNINLRNLRLSIDDYSKRSTFLATLKEGHIGVDHFNFERDSFVFRSISLLRPECTMIEVNQSHLFKQNREDIVQDSISKKPNSDFFLNIAILEVNEGAFQRIKSDSLVNKELKNTLDVDDLDIVDLDLFSTDLVMTSACNIEASIKSLALKEHNGLVLENAKVDSFRILPNEILLGSFELDTEHSQIKDFLSFKFDSFNDFKSFAKKIHIESDMSGSEIALSDLSYFLPGIVDSKFIKRNKDRKVSITGSFNGTVDHLEADNLFMTVDNLIEFTGSFTSSNLTNPQTALVSIYVNELKTSLNNIRRIVPEFNLPDQFYKLDPVSFTGDIEGFFKDFVIYGNLKSRLGNVELDTRLNTKAGVNNAEYSGELALNNFNVKEWTGNEDFGFATLSAKIENGRGLTLENVKTDLVARLEKFEFRDYAYSNISLEGVLEKNLFDGKFSAKGPNVDMDFEGQLIIKDNYFKSDFLAVINKINPKAINLSDDYSLVTGDFNISIEGKTLNEFSGSAELNNLAVVFKNKTFDFNEVYFSSAPLSNERRNLLLTSDIINASVDGKFDFGQLGASFTNYIVEHHPNWAKKFKINTQDKRTNKIQDFVYKIEVFDTKDYLELLKANELRFRGVTFEGAINLPDNTFSSNISIDSSFYKDYEFSAFGLSLTNSKKISKLILDLDKIATQGKYYEPLNIRSEVNGDDVKLEIKTKNVLDSIGYVDLTLNIKPIDDMIQINVGNKNLQMFSADWEIDASNEIIYGTDYLSIKDFVLSDGYRSLFIQDYKKSGMEFTLENFDFLLVNGLINYDKIDFAGESKIYARVANVFTKPKIVADIRIPEFTLNDVDYGSLSVRLDDDGDMAYASLNLNRVEDDLRVLVNAEYNKLTKGVSGSVEMRNMVMKIFEFIIDDGISKTDGIANLDVEVSGTIDDIKLNGTANVIGGQTRIDYIGSLIDLGTETFPVTDNFIDLTGVSLFDKFGNQATMTGGLHHDLFTDFRTDLNMQANRFLALDTDKTDNPMYYGIGIGPISIDFAGPFSSTDISISATTGSGTVLNIPIEDSYYNIDQSFIKFVPREDVLNPKEDDESQAMVKLEGVDVDMNLSITNDAQVNIIFDERLNDVIKGVGNGDLRITIARDGKFNIYGEYEVDRGDYLFTAWGIVAKPFKVRRGGLITWTGDPINANLNIEADYDDLRAPVNILLAEYLVTNNVSLEQEAKKRTRIDLTLKVGGTLYNPIVNFDIAFPELQGELRTYADSKMITLRENEADLNEQVAGLIMFRSFLPSSTLGNVFTTSNSFVETTYNTLSEFVSNQLSYLLSGFLQEALTDNGFISGIDFEIGFSKNANLLEGAPQSDNYLPDEIEVHFKPRFQNDKWGFDYGTSFVNSNGRAANPIANYIIHDFVLEYYLTADRRLKLRAYGKWDKDEVVFQNEQKYGLGINYRKEFGSITNFKKSLKADMAKLKPDEKINE